MSRPEDVPSTGPGGVQVRDLDRIRERISLSMEPVHVVLLGVALALLVAAAFATGVWVGRSGREVRADDDDEPVMMASSEAVPRLRPEAGPVRAAGRSPSVARAVSASVLPAPDEPRATARETMEPVVPAARRDLAQLPRDVLDPGVASARRDLAEVPPDPPAPVADATPWPSTAVTDAGRLQSCTDPAGCPCPPPPAAPLLAGLEPVAGAVPATLDPPVAAPREKPASPDPAVAKPAPAAPRPKAAAKPAAPPAVVAPTYEVQVRSSRDEATAKADAEALGTRGYPARVTRFQDDHGTWYRVRLGSFKSAPEAARFAKDFNGREDAAAIPVPREGTP